MTCTLEKVLADAKSLVERLRDHDSAAEILIEQTTLLNKRVEAMKQVSVFILSLYESNQVSPTYSLFFQYQEEIEVLNQVARHRPRSTLVMGIQQENRQIRDLQQENKGVRRVCNYQLSFEGCFKSKSALLSRQSCACHWRSISLRWRSS